MSDEVADSRSILTHDGIRKQLHRILDDQAARAAGVLARFLQFVVEETLQGRKFELKEYTIGTQVFKRPASFAPHSDAIVRISAGRLRRLLTEYYERAGATDTIRIEIPKGTYVPVFRVSVPNDELSPPDTKSRTNGLTLAVLRFANIDRMDAESDAFADSFSERLCELLCATQDFSVISYTQSRRHGEGGSDIRSIGKSLDAQYLITGNLRFLPDKIRLNVQLVFSGDATIVWSDTYHREVTTALVDVQTEIAAKLRMTLGSLCGVFVNHLSQVPSFVRSLILNRHESIYWLYLTKQIATPEILLLARPPVEDAMRRYPHYSTPLAVGAHFHLDSRLLNAAAPADSVSIAMDLAERCIALNSQDQHGYSALAYAYLTARRRDEALGAIERALSLGAHSLGIKGFAGTYLVCAGEYRQGAKYLEETAEAGQQHSWFFDVAFTLYYFSQQDYKNAYVKSKMTKLNTTHIGQLLRASATARVGGILGVNETRDCLKLDPQQARKIISDIVLDERVVDDIITGWQDAVNNNKATITE